MKNAGPKGAGIFFDSLKFLKTTLSSFSWLQIFINCIPDIEKCDDE